MEAIDDPKTKPPRKLNAHQKRALRTADLSLFVIRYARKRQKSGEPNDRRYDREIE